MGKKGLDFSKILSKEAPPPAPPHEGDFKYNFVSGHTDPEVVPIEELAKSAAKVIREKGRKLAMYHSDGGPLGSIDLRKFLSKKLATTRGITASPDEIMITSGSTQGILLINDSFLDPGDTVITELFTYSGSIREARRRKANVIGIPLDDNGLRVDLVEQKLEELKEQGITPKYIYTIPTNQNPTGTNMPMDRRFKLLELSSKYGVPIFEDECYADLVFEGEWFKSIKALDEDNHVIHIGSLSKSLAPGVRLGYLIAPAELLAQFLSSKVDVGTNMITPMIAADFLNEHYQAHSDNVRERLHRKRDTLTASLKEHFGPTVKFFVPRGGQVLWIEFPKGTDTKQPLEAAKKQGIIYNPGADWSVEPEQASNFVRLCYANPSEEAIREGIGKLAQVFQEEIGVP
ncbi:uncharacterized protein METZ01_LOCUS115780 [marine metagenome]|uniref:Aminotransferase class I/classII large domain-containing protein n=1 Tax=marine metagenome TaxID=408172 RepID=A0A381XDU5_9ZZZZ